MIGESTGVAFNEAALADGGGRLESREVAGSAFDPEGGETGGDSSGADEDGRMTGLPQIVDLGGDPFDRFTVDPTAAGGETR
jgi:hypothetical protein